jgi:hypothetical protein
MQGLRTLLGIASTSDKQQLLHAAVVVQIPQQPWAHFAVPWQNTHKWCVAKIVPFYQLYTAGMHPSWPM